MLHSHTTHQPGKPTPHAAAADDAIATAAAARPYPAANVSQLDAHATIVAIVAAIAAVIAVATGSSSGSSRHHLEHSLLYTSAARAIADADHRHQASCSTPATARVIRYGLLAAPNVLSAPFKLNYKKRKRV